MSKYGIAAGWVGIVGLSGVTLQQMRYNHYYWVREKLNKDCANSGVIKMYDKWLEGGFIHQILYEPGNPDHLFKQLGEHIVRVPYRIVKHFDNSK